MKNDVGVLRLSLRTRSLGLLAFGRSWVVRSFWWSDRRFYRCGQGAWSGRWSMPVGGSDGGLLVTGPRGFASSWNCQSASRCSSGAATLSYSDSGVQAPNHCVPYTAYTAQNEADMPASRWESQLCLCCTRCFRQRRFRQASAGLHQGPCGAKGFCL